LLTESELWNKLDKVVNSLAQESEAIGHLLQEVDFLSSLSEDEMKYISLIRKQQERLA